MKISNVHTVRGYYRNQNGKRVFVRPHNRKGWSVLHDTGYRVAGNVKVMATKKNIRDGDIFNGSGYYRRGD